MNPQRETELKTILAQLEDLNQRLALLQEQEENAKMILPKKSPERKAADERIDAIDDAYDSVTDAIHSLEELFEEE
ncbi:MAG: hypothetical protein LUE89_04980 [Clostridiales bacterium]|nr:hypothetical protein [Clostridiales bacterium]MCD8354093.1 hypothetical protein [Clostridiales bacterium]